MVILDQFDLDDENENTQILQNIQNGVFQQEEEPHTNSYFSETETLKNRLSTQNIEKLTLNLLEASETPSFGHDNNNSFPVINNTNGDLIETEALETTCDADA